MIYKALTNHVLTTERKFMWVSSTETSTAHWKPRKANQDENYRSIPVDQTLNMYTQGKPQKHQTEL